MNNGDVILNLNTAKCEYCGQPVRNSIQAEVCLVSKGGTEVVAFHKRCVQATVRDVPWFNARPSNPRDAEPGTMGPEPVKGFTVEDAGVVNWQHCPKCGRSMIVTDGNFPAHSSPLSGNKCDGTPEPVDPDSVDGLIAKLQALPPDVRKRAIYALDWDGQYTNPPVRVSSDEPSVLLFEEGTSVPA